MKIATIFLLASLASCFDLSTSTIQNTCLQQLLQNHAPQFIQDLGNLLCKYQLAKTSQNQELFMEFLTGVNKLLDLLADVCSRRSCILLFCLTTILSADTSVHVKNCMEQERFAVGIRLYTEKFLAWIEENAGCTLDSLLGIRVVPTLENCEKIADQVADILFGFLNHILGLVADVVNSLPSLVSDIVDRLVPEIGAVLDILGRITDVKDFSCDVMEDILPTVAKILSIGGDILDHILNDLGREQTKPIVHAA